MSPVIDVDTRTLAIAGVIVLAGVVAASLFVVDVSRPEIREGTFATSDGGLLAVADVACSSDSDCPSTTCDGSDYLVDTDEVTQCTDHDNDGDIECTGYDESYADADHCGGRYDYNCDGAGCEGYKAACEDDCSANAGCDTYSFCSSDTSDDGDESTDSDDSTDSTDTSDSETRTCTDACTSLTKQCGTDGVVQCQDTDGDGCTDGYVPIASCETCDNGACMTTTPPNESTDVAEELDPAPTDPAGSQTLVDRLREVYQRVLVALLGGL